MSEDFGTRAASAEVEIRRATVADAEAGAWCHLLCWQEAYAGLLAPERLREKTDPQGIGRRTERWAAAIDAGVVRWLALNPAAGVPVRDRVIGFSSPGPARDEDAPTPLELYAIYTRKAWVGDRAGAAAARRRDRPAGGQLVGAGGQRPRLRLLPPQWLRRGRGARR